MAQPKTMTRGSASALPVDGMALLLGLSLGAASMFFLDPDRGARRRARMRDAATHAAHVARRASGKAQRDAWHRVQGTAALARGLLRRGVVDDGILIGRVRARLGRLVSHAHALHVTITDGRVTLSGPILDREADHLLQAVRRVSGVQEVVDMLDRRKEAGNLPALQGGRMPAGERPDVMQLNWAPATRAAAGAAGLTLLATGAVRRGTAGAAAAAAGALLLGRAATNTPLNRLLGIGADRRPVDVQKSITIDAPVKQVYDFWTAFENFPRFMSRVLEVTPSQRVPGQSHWRVAGPAGTPVEFDAEVTRAVPNQMLTWRTVPGAPVAHAGVVRFDPDGGRGTRVQVRMSYSPPGGRLGHGVAALFGADPKRSMDQDLMRMKALIETSHPPRDAAV